MKHILEFTLPDEAAELSAASKGAEYLYVLEAIRKLLRENTKEQRTDAETLDFLRRTLALVDLPS
jgi:hypothetical protein